jgi:hypothetical protein
MKRGKARSDGEAATEGRQKYLKIFANIFCGNPKVPEKAAVTGLDVAKKSRLKALFLVP